MTSIIVTTDLSEESLQAFPLAKKLAKDWGASVTLLAVVEDPTQVAFAYAMELPTYPDPEIHRQRLKKVASDLDSLKAQHFSGLKCDTAVVESVGGVGTEICVYAKEHAADLIVISSHGRSGLPRLLLGSVAERVTRESPCPVLLIPLRKNQ